MTKQQILKKAIEKAVKNGWDISLDLPPKLEEYLDMTSGGIGEFAYRNALWIDAHYRIIFSHDFAKAFWGDRYICPVRVKQATEDDIGMCSECKDFDHTLKAFLYHLQQMVLEKDPIKYLEKFILKKRGGE